MAPKRKLSEKRREYIKSNFERIKPDLLKPEERLYYSRVKGGKERAKNAIRIDGKMQGAKFEERAEAIARAAGYRGSDVARYVSQNEDVFRNLIERGKLKDEPQSFNKLSKFVKEKKNGSFYIQRPGTTDEDGNFKPGKKERVSKKQLLKELAETQSFMMQNYNAPQTLISATYTEGGQMIIPLPGMGLLEATLQSTSGSKDKKQAGDYDTFTELMNEGYGEDFEEDYIVFIS